MHITLMNNAYSFNRHSKSDISRNIATYNQGAEKGGLMGSSLASTFFGIFETFLTKSISVAHLPNHLRSSNFEQF